MGSAVGLDMISGVSGNGRGCINDCSLRGWPKIAPGARFFEKNCPQTSLGVRWGKIFFKKPCPWGNFGPASQCLDSSMSRVKLNGMGNPLSGLVYNYY
jgi:hypothetical protein